MPKIISPNLIHLCNSLHSGKRGVILEGSSRSTKTWAGVDFLIYLCTKIEKSATIHIIKETYNSFKTTLFEDFDRRFPMFGIPSPSAGRKELNRFSLFGNTVNLLGADSVSKVHGSGSDYFWMNESLAIENPIFDQYEMRCRKFWWMDYNPSVTQHWIYDRLENRSDVDLLRTTFLDNPHISDPEKIKILSYEPWHPEDRHLPIKDRRPHPINIEQGTANEYNWNVYGLGLRSVPEGIVFQDVTWIDKFPEECENVVHGLDFGYVNDPTALVKLGVIGRNLFLEKRHYESTPNSNVLIAMLKDKLGGFHAWADSSDPGLISDCRRAGLKIYAVKKFHGSIEYGINLINGYKLHIVDCPEFRSEQENYKYRKINGIKTNIPVDGFDHLWDASRYGAISEIRPR